MNISKRFAWNYARKIIWRVSCVTTWITKIIFRLIDITVKRCNPIWPSLILIGISRAISYVLKYLPNVISCDFGAVRVVSHGITGVSCRPPKTYIALRFSEGNFKVPCCICICSSLHSWFTGLSGRRKTRITINCAISANSSDIDRARTRNIEIFSLSLVLSRVGSLDKRLI